VKSRNPTLDIMKGIGILLVVLSHALSKKWMDVTISYDNGLFNVISSFFMLMFFVISGYLTYGKVSRQGWLKEHISKWILPLLSFAVIYWVFAYFLPNLIQFYVGFYEVSFWDYISTVLTSGFNGIITWYLWALILCYIFAWILEQGRLKLKLPLVIQSFIMIVVINIIPITLFGFFVFKWYGIFFIIGYTLHHYSINKKLAYISLVAFPLMIYLTNWMIPYQDSQWGCYGLTKVIPAIMNGHALLVGLMFLMAVLGTAFVYSIAMLIKWKPLAKLLTYLGSISIGIYLIHIMFVGITKNYWISTILATIISVALYEILKRIKFTNYILFGGTPIKFNKLGGWYEKKEQG
jgi:fucose 4-O-acetylase-like acetyltransferase